MNDRPDSDTPPPAPRWVKAFGLAALVLVLAFAAVHLAGGGFRHHGPAAMQDVPAR